MRIDEATLTIMSDAFEYPTAHHVRIVKQLDRAAYQRVDKVLVAIGGKWSRAAKAHTFTSDARPLVDAVIDSGMVDTARDIGWFPSPPAVVAELLQRAEVRPGMRVLEPSAGTGSIVVALLAMPSVRVVAVERHLERRAALRAIVSRDTQALLTIADVDDFLDTSPGSWKLGGAERGPWRFHRVVMNPPFCKVGNGDHIDHVQHAWSMLAPDGVLVSVMPSSITFRQDRRHVAFRAWVAERGGAIEPLPDDSFKASGTGVRTVVVTVARDGTS